MSDNFDKIAAADDTIRPKDYAFIMDLPDDTLSEPCVITDIVLRVASERQGELLEKSETANQIKFKAASALVHFREGPDFDRVQFINFSFKNEKELLSWQKFLGAVGLKDKDASHMLGIKNIVGSADELNSNIQDWSKENGFEKNDLSFHSLFFKNARDTVSGSITWEISSEAQGRTIAKVKGHISSKMARFKAAPQPV